MRPPREWIDGSLDAADEFRRSEPELTTDAPEARPLGSQTSSASRNEAAAIKVGETLVRGPSGGPEGSPELYAERFDETTAGAAERGQS